MVLIIFHVDIIIDRVFNIDFSRVYNKGAWCARDIAYNKIYVPSNYSEPRLATFALTYITEDRINLFLHNEYKQKNFAMKC